MMDDSDQEEFHDVESPGDGGGQDVDQKVRARRDSKSEERGDSDEKFGFKVVSSMSEVDLETLLNRLDANSPPMDLISVTIRTKKLDWNTVAFDDFSAEECRAAWEYLRSLTRKFRIMSEVVREIKLITEKDKDKFRAKLIESAPDFPKKPPSTGCQMFVREMWNINPEKKNFIMFQREAMEKYNGLSDEVKLDWENKCQLLKADHNREVKQFYSNFPHYTAFVTSKRIGKFNSEKKKTPRKPAGPRPQTKLSQDAISIMYSDAPVLPLSPQTEFIQSKLNRLATPPDSVDLPELKRKYKDKWKTLSDKKKSKWIGRVIKRCEEYLQEMECFQIIHPEFVPKPFKLRQHIQKEELAIWEHYRQKPKKPAQNVIEMYFNEMVEEPEFADLSREEARKVIDERFRNLSSYDKEMIKINYRKEVIEYRKNIATYFEELPEFLRPVVLQTIPKKFHSTITSVDKTVDEVSADEDEREKDPLALTDYDDNDPESVPKNEAYRRRKIAKLEEELKDPEEELKDEPQSPPKKKRKKDRKILENEEAEGEEVKDEPASPSKKKKKRKHDEQSPLENDKATPVTVAASTSNGTPKAKASKKSGSVSYESLKRLVRKRDPKEFVPGRRPTQSDLNEIMRGMLDATQYVHRAYSVFYYYGKYVGGSLCWVRRTRSFGISRAAKLAYKTFLRLPEFQKWTFINESYNFFKNMHHPKLLEQCAKPARRRELVQRIHPGEPHPPPTSANKLYNAEMKVVKRNYPKLVIPEWETLDEKIQTLYMKKLFRNTKNYVKEYEQFVMNMTPNDMLVYTAFAAENWDAYRCLNNATTRYAGRGFIFPFSNADFSADEDVEAEDSDPEIIDPETYQQRTRNATESNLPEVQNVLVNDGLLKAITKKVTREDPTIAEIMEDSSSGESDNPTDSDDDENIFKFGCRRSQITVKMYKKRVNKLGTRRSRFLYDLDAIPDEVPEKEPEQHEDGWTLKQLKNYSSNFVKQKVKVKKRRESVLKRAKLFSRGLSVGPARKSRPDPEPVPVPVPVPVPEMDAEDSDSRPSYTSEQADELFELLPSPSMPEPEEEDETTLGLDPPSVQSSEHSESGLSYPTLRRVTEEEPHEDPEPEEAGQSSPAYYDLPPMKHPIHFEEAEEVLDYDFDPFEDEEAQEDEGEDPYQF